jgi:hypothetical protein
MKFVGSFVKRVDLLTALALMASLSWAGAVNAQKQKKDQLTSIRVFVAAGSSSTGFVDPGHEELTDSIADLKKALAQKKVITLVDERGSADIIAQVVGRGFTGTGTELATQGEPRFAIVRVTLSAGDYTTTIDGHNDGRLLGAWRTAANDAARQIEEWIRDNRDKLLARRAS